ncbi:hypothetical protein BJF78_03490 [Pseudonocardia sp. CNS-139]|nr:hypothetical protein BJF78_03490 [Pseudonocardia sp. CNS-139]
MLRRATGLVAILCAVVLGTAAPATAAPGPGSWSADLDDAEPAGVQVSGGAARLDPDTTFTAAAEEADPEATMPRPTGLLTFPPHRLTAPTDRVAAVLDAEVPPGAFATVDVRGRRGNGAWTEWVPATRDAGGLAVALPGPTSEVQARLVLAGDPGAGPAVRGVRLTAHPATKAARTEDADQIPLSYRVFATREGLVGGTTANGHVITPRDHFVALPSRRALAPRDTSDYSVKVCAPTGRCAFAPVWDVGPWNTRDDYWNPGPTRQQWGDLPQGVPQAQAAHEGGYNGGRDQYNRRVANPAGIDLGDGMFWDALGLTGNAWVTVDYLWTGGVRLSLVDGVGKILAAPDAAAEVVGIVAERAAVPVQCVLATATGRWLRLGVGQYLTASLVPAPGEVPACR